MTITAISTTAADVVDGYGTCSECSTVNTRVVGEIGAALCDTCRKRALAAELRILVISAPHEHTRTTALDALQFGMDTGFDAALRYLRLATGSCVVPTAVAAARLLAQYGASTSVYCERNEHTKCATEGGSMAGRTPCACSCRHTR